MNFPLVVKEEDYTRSGVRTKLGLSYEAVLKLAKQGRIRPKNQTNFHYRERKPDPVDTQSLAEVISEKYKRPVSEILQTEQALQQREYCNQAERVTTLYGAYLGCRWFEYFRRKAQREPQRTIKLWQKPTKSELEQWLNTTKNTIKKLCQKGFIIPETVFIPHSKNNYVNIEALAQLLYLIHGIDTKIEKKNQLLEDLVESYTSQRLVPCLEGKRIKPQQEYTLQETAKILNTYPSQILYAKILPEQILGVDIAIHYLKKTWKRTFTTNEVAELFGMKEINFEELGIRTTPKGTCSRTNYIFPIYDLIASKSRKKILKSPFW